MRKVSFLITITVALTLVAGCGASESVVPAAAASVSTSVPVTPTATPAPAPTSISPCINPTKDGWKVIAGNSEYEQYRSNSIPEGCRMPEYEDDARLWKEHLSHHEQTFHCLEYYGDIN